MLFISIPNGENQGKAKINGKPVEFEIVAGIYPDVEFWFRSPGVAKWDKRKVLGADFGEKLTALVCADADGSGGVVIGLG